MPKRGAYYNENDRFAAEWLRALMLMGEIAEGDVDERSIEDVCADDLAPYVQCHFFAGIGVWSAALRRARWEDDRPVWTGSCPCQPFSAAGKGAGFADERHLWPAWFWLIEQHRPGVVFGEQVASKNGLQWFDLVSADLEGAGYATGALDLCAAGVGAPHIRQRLWFVAIADGRNARSKGLQRSGQHGQQQADGRAVSALVDASSQQAGLPRRAWEPGSAMADTLFARRPEGRSEPGSGSASSSSLGIVDIATGCGREGLRAAAAQREPRPPGQTWVDLEWVLCCDEKWRPVEPGSFPLAHGSPARVGRLRGYGNALVLPLAQTFVEEVMVLL